MPRYAVIGNPVAQSKSPQIHQLFAAQSGESMDYTRLLAEDDDFEQVVNDFMSNDGHGLSVTMPFKRQAFDLVDQLTPRAERAGAVNMITAMDGILVGDNTDGMGLVTDLLTNLGWPIQDTRLLVLGAGGAGRGILSNLLAEKPSKLVLANRTRSKALQLAAEFSDVGLIEPCGLDELDHDFDLILNATSASLQGTRLELSSAIIRLDTCCYDLAYAKGDTTFITWSRSLGGTRMTDGLGMLVEQAAVQYLGWRGVKPETAQVISNLRSRQ